MYYVKTDCGVRIAVYDLNPKGRKTVFFIHGWPVDHNMFEYQFDILPLLGFRCISVDLRGFGNSDAPWDGYDYDRMADDIYEVIRTLNVAKMTLVGFSMGGAVAVRYMARHRGYRIGKLVLLSAAVPAFTKRRDFSYGLTRETVDGLIAQATHNRPQMMEDLSKIFFANKTTDSFLRWFNRLNDDSTGHSTIKTAETLRDADLRDDLQQINVPTGIFHGTLDKICPYDLALVTNKAIPDSRLFRFEQSGHGIFYDELEKFTSQLIAFLNT